jgi:hypothetical protein
MRYLVLLLAAGLLAGCNPADAQKAQDILQRAQEAEQSVSSESFLMKMSFSYEGRTAELQMQGAGYRKSGDFYMTMTGSVPGQTTPLDLALVKQGDVVRIRANGQTQTLSVAQAQQRLGSGVGQFSQFTELARYVKDGSVSEADFQGRPADKLVGVLDTHALFFGAAGVSQSVFSQAGIRLGDLRVVLFVPRDTHLVEAMVADVTLSAGGKSVAMNMSLGITGVNEPVQFPTL